MTQNNKSSIISLPKIADDRGHLSFIEKNMIPFDIKRVYFLYDIPHGSKRGGHAHKEQEQFIIPIAGSFSVILNDGWEEQCYTLNTPSEGLYVPKNTWRELQNFSSGAVCLVVSSGEFDENDYIRDYEEFLKFTHELTNL